ncbi:major histocompatibility complex class I-related gene protein-like [Nematolebias whitei]|uniref:major histocompatibility complex class I-related gene protein-like n=1 Tax=Nematolebias whitei TaxID=451745 RepID=UPI00189BE153|nr:major histocompatibility complex class I-related gene protein-like [Nematolebias whitei]
MFLFFLHVTVSSGIHTFQRMNGCYLDEQTGDFNAFNQYGYDGKDLISFDLETMTWITPQHQTVITKHNWNRDGDGQFWKFALTEECRQFLQMYLAYGKSSLQTPVSPSVSLLQKTPSSPVTCHATGFYPDRAEMFWKKDGEEVHDGVNTWEILPNNDGTFQMSADLDISSISPEDWQKFDCVFQLSGLKDSITTRLDQSRISTNFGKTQVERH